MFRSTWPRGGSFECRAETALPRLPHLCDHSRWGSSFDLVDRSIVRSSVVTPDLPGHLGHYLA